MSARAACICGSPLARKQFSEHFDALACARCGSTHFGARVGAPAPEFEYGSGSEKYARRQYLYGKQLRWAHQWLLRQAWSGRKVAEVGCFNGFFLDELRKQGADVYGYDVNEDALEVGRSLFALQGRLHQSLELVSKAGPFDDVICIDVLEHLDAPEDTLALAELMLVPGGRISIAGPTIERRFHDKSDYPPHHKWWFSRSGLATLCKSCGLDVCEMVIQRDPVLLARNVAGKVLHGIGRREFFGEASVSPPAFIDGPVITAAARAINTVMGHVLQGLGFSYCSTILIARKRANA